MVSKEEEQALEEYLQGKSEVSRRYRSEATQQPAKHLDEAILAASRKAVATKPRAVPRPFASNWYVPVSLAAVLVLCIGLVFNIYQDSGHELLTTPSPPSSIGGFDQLPATSGRAETALPSRSFKQDGKVELDGLLEEEKIEVQEFRRQEDRKSNQPAFDADIAPATAPMTELEDKAMDKITPLLKESSVEIKAAKPEDIETIWRQKKKQVEDAKSPAPEALGAIGGDYPTLEKNEARKEAFLDAPGEKQGETTVADEVGFAIEEQVELEAAQMRSREIAGSKLKRSGKDDVANIPPEQWLTIINQQWQAGQKNKAEENLKRFVAAYPYFTQIWLSERLPQDINLSKYVK